MNTILLNSEIASCGHIVSSCACEICKSIYSRNRYQQNRTKILERVRLYKINNYEKVLECNRKYIKENRLEIREKQRNSPQSKISKNTYREKHRRDAKWWIRDRISYWRSKYPAIQSNLTTDYLYNLLDNQQNKCYYTGEELVWGGCGGKACPNSGSLDRLDPEKGYTQGNVVWCSFFVNTMKGRLSESEFYVFMKNILKRKSLC